MPGVAGFVTVTGLDPAVAMADAGIMAVNCFVVTRVVVSRTPLKFTVAPAPKLSPLTVKVNPGLPAFILSGERSVMAGMTPGCGAFPLGELYPHPAASIVSDSTAKIIFMFMTFLHSNLVSE